MRIAVLSRGPQLYSTQRILRAGRNRGYTMELIDYSRCSVLLTAEGPQISYQGRVLDDLNAIIPRIGTSATALGAAIIHQFTLQSVFSTTAAQPLLVARDKMHCLQHLAGAGIPVPLSAIAGEEDSLSPLVARLGGFPLVVKPISSTHGEGVMLIDSWEALQAARDAFAFRQERVLLQEFIPEANGSDIRVLIVNGQIIAAMKRQARPGDFRANLHQGGSARAVRLTAIERQTVLRAANLLGLSVAGVDFLRSDRGPLLLEVNASPGLEGIESVTGKDVAGAIVDYAASGAMARQGALISA